MTNDLSKPLPDYGDGFAGSPTSDVTKLRNYVKWNDTKHWTDRDGLPMPSPVVVIGVNEGLQRWKNNQVQLITKKPLPDIQTSNAAIPVSEWEKGFDGKPRPPFEHVVIVIMVDPVTGATYKYTAATVGAHIAYDQLRESVMTTRLLRGGEHVLPVVDLTERPMKLKGIMGLRPHFHIVGWKQIGGGSSQMPPTPPTPQLTGPETLPAPGNSAPASTTSATPSQAKPKPPVNLASETLAGMGDVAPATTAEILNDEVPW